MAAASIAPEPPGERLRSVTVVGTAFLVVASLRFLLDLLGWFVWKLGNAEPVVSYFLPRGDGGWLAIDRFVLRHFPTVVAVQGTVAACVAGISIQFLRLRPWARRALELVAWAVLAVITAVMGALVVTAARRPAAPIARPLAGAVAVLLVLDLILGAAIRAMRRPDVRAAFRPRENAGS